MKFKYVLYVRNSLAGGWRTVSEKFNTLYDVTEHLIDYYPDVKAYKVYAVTDQKKEMVAYELRNNAYDS